MSITRAEIERLAKLAKLKFTDAEIEKLTHQLDQIIEYVNKINELDLADVPPMHHVLEVTNVMRDDEVTEGLSQEEVLMNAPARHGGFFSVPKVIRQQSNQQRKKDIE